MPNWLVNGINDWFGSNITHVANAYSHSDCIWLRFQRERMTIDQISAGLQSLDVNLKNKEMKMSLVRLPFNEVHIERRNTSSEYLTVFAKNRDGTKITICRNLEIPANRSYIVTDKGGIKESGYDKNYISLWHDCDRHNHKT